MPPHPGMGAPSRSGVGPFLPFRRRFRQAMAITIVVKHPLRQAEFVLGAAQPSQLPPPGPPEVAFAGRSNAGKSSAINALAQRTRLAFASKTPGRTQQINFFRLRNGALLADLPGYGYAAVPQSLKAHWQAFLGSYLATRQSLVGLVLVVDARHGFGTLDHVVLAGFLPSSRPLLVLATKADKLAAMARRTACRTMEADLAAAHPGHAGQVRIIPFSATHHLGVEEADLVLGDWFDDGPDDSRPPPLPANARTSGKERAPRSRGVSRGPKRLA